MKEEKTKTNLPIKKLLRLIILVIVVIVVIVLGKIFALYLGNIVKYFL